MSKKNTINNVKLGEKQEQNDFLIRSLDRNDLEITALMDLHRSIHAVKQAILRNCGEETLLDLGEGKLKLAPSSDSLQAVEGVELPPEENQYLCVDFLLRMKLRRKLMNRLSRRLLRVAHIMDGNDLQPPPVPKYGEQRLHLDPERIKAFSEHFANREMAIRTIEMAKKRIYNKESSVEATTTDGPEQMQSIDAPKEEQTREEGPEQARSTDASKEENPAEKETTSQEQPADSKEPAQAAEGDAPEPVPSAEDKAPEESLLPVADAATSVATGDQPVSAEESSKSNITGPTEDVLEACYQMLIDYKDVYEKIIDPVTGAITYPALESERETTNTSTGIGAAHSSMSVKEKEAEDQRWKTALLSRIPDQPTFEELGLENRVFYLEERRKRAVTQRAAEQNKRAKVDVDNNASDDEDMSDKREMDDDEKSGSAEKSQAVDVAAQGVSESQKGDKDKVNEEESDKGPDHDDEESETKEKDDEKESSSETTKEKDEVVPVRIKPISLLPVPSFHDQDLKRIKLIHADLMMSSMQDHARVRLEGVTRDYNSALAKSNDLYDRQLKIQEELNLRRRNNAIMKSQFDMHAAQLREGWLVKLKIFNDRKLNLALPSRQGHPRTGSFVTQQYGRRDAFALEISDCLADVVDGVDKIVQGMVPNEKFVEPFTLPPLPPEFEQSLNYEKVLFQQSQTLMQTLRGSEDERSKCWKRMMKTKAEFEVGRPDANRYAAMPFPPLRSTAPQVLPQQLSRPVLSTYTPKARIVRQAELSESKYSAARVKERIADDGTVAPVSEPKRTAEGLFQRPAGRTRKGMDWDAIRGIWVPHKEEDK